MITISIDASSSTASTCLAEVDMAPGGGGASTDEPAAQTC
jgi:hypothetical protein